MMISKTNQTFCQAVCERYQCSAEKYPLVVWRLCLPRGKRWLGRLVFLVSPNVFYDDFILIRDVSMDTRPQDIELEVESFRRTYRFRGFFRRDLNLRLSTRALLRLGWELLDQEHQPAANDLETEFVHKPSPDVPVAFPSRNRSNTTG
ncbi:MAG: hypothetical protein WCO56_00180 [Verrucomicrobiota bacterium]